MFPTKKNKTKQKNKVLPFIAFYLVSKWLKFALCRWNPKLGWAGNQADAVSISQTSESQLYQQNGSSGATRMPSSMPILPCADGKPWSTFNLDNYFLGLPGRNIIFIFYPLRRSPWCFCSSLVMSFRADLAFGTKHLFPLLHSDRTSQPLSLRDIQFLELNLESPCPVSHDMDCKDLKSQKPLKIATS